MKKSTQKGIAVAVLILAAVGAYYKFGKPMTSGAMAKKDTLKPKEFSTPLDREGNSTKFWFDGVKYWMQKGGPTVKAKAIEISEADYSQQYAN